MRMRYGRGDGGKGGWGESREPSPSPRPRVSASPRQILKISWILRVAEGTLRPPRCPFSRWTKHEHAAKDVFARSEGVSDRHARGAAPLRDAPARVRHHAVAGGPPDRHGARDTACPDSPLPPSLLRPA